VARPNRRKKKPAVVSTKVEVIAPEPDYASDPNVQARLRAGKRSDSMAAGNPADAPLEPEAEGGIVAEAEQELAAVEGEGVESEAEMPAEDAEPEVEPNGETETGAEEAVEPEAAEEGESEEGEPETAIEAFADEEMSEPAHQDSGAIEEYAAEEAQEEQHQEPMVDDGPGEYQSPDGEMHEDLIDQYHEALAFGDMEAAKDLYKKLQNHRYSENAHRGKSEAHQAKTEAQAAKELQAYVDVANELAMAHPQLAEDNIESDKVLALSDVYRNNGMNAADALRQAVADLYPEEAAVEEPAAEPELPVEPEEAAMIAEEPEVAEPEPEPEPLIPDMTERKANKRNIPTMPIANARVEPTPAAKVPGRTDAIEAMKKQRGQA
jgi:hypothetical protein